MIKITFTQRGKILSLRLEGHAGYAEHGKDIVCASASILAYTVAQYITMASESGDLVAPPVIKLDKGDAYVSCEPTEETARETQGMFEYAMIGYQLLARNYPRFVDIITDVEAYNAP